MSAVESQISSLNRKRPEALDRPRQLPHSEDSEETRWLTRLTAGGALAWVEWQALRERLGSESDPERLATLVRCFRFAPKQLVSLTLRLAALERLITCDQVFLRAEGYRGLAQLHRLDLRYEQRAKRIMVRGLDREVGLARRRLEAELRGC